MRSLRFNQEALEAIRYLKQDVNGYILNGAEGFELAQVDEAGTTIAERLKKYSAIFNDQEVSSFLALAEEDSDDETQVLIYIYFSAQKERSPKEKRNPTRVNLCRLRGSREESLRSYR